MSIYLGNLCRLLLFISCIPSFHRRVCHRFFFPSLKRGETGSLTLRTHSNLNHCQKMSHSSTPNSGTAPEVQVHCAVASQTTPTRARCISAGTPDRNALQFLEDAGQKLTSLTSKVYKESSFILILSNTVSHRSEYTPHIFVNILLYLFMWQHWRNYTLLQYKVVSVQLV